MCKKIIFGCCLTLLLLCAVFVFSGCGGDVGLTEYDIDCVYNEGVISGKEKVKYYNNTDNAFNQLKFNLHANAFRKDAKYKPIATQYSDRAYYKGESFGGYEILSVSCESGNLEYKICGEDLNVLSVNLPQTVYPDETFSLTIEYNLKLANVIGRTGINEKTVNLANFYPILCAYDEQGFYECLYYTDGDPYYSECANYVVTFTYPNEYIVASSGKVFSSNSNEKTRKDTYKICKARSFCMVMSTEFDMVTSSVEGITVNYYYYNDDNAEKSLQTAKKSILTFNETFGKYAYNQYSVVQTKFMQGGMEFPALVMISDNLEEQAYNEVIIHETAHQWWQTGVGNNEIEYGFLDEGLTEYSVVLFYEKHGEYNFTRENLIKSSLLTYKTFCSVYDKLKGNVNTVMLRPLKEFESEYEYVNIAYIKPCIMFDILRQTIGDEMFFKGLKKYYGEYCFLNATPYDLVGVFEKIGADTNGFFDSFFFGKVIL